MRYVGLTDKPVEKKRDHGNPQDFKLAIHFNSKTAARSWEKRMLKGSGYKGGTAGKGWKFGYIYTITNDTKE